MRCRPLLRRTIGRSPHAIYKTKYEGRYCVHDKIDVSESVKPVDCPICGRAAKMVCEERYFFRLSAFQQGVVGLYKPHPEFVQPQLRSREIEKFVRKGLKDLPISRRATEGVVAR
jgi:methionyl-tRNA synthetase